MSLLIRIPTKESDTCLDVYTLGGPSNPSETLHIGVSTLDRAAGEKGNIELTRERAAWLANRLGEFVENGVLPDEFPPDPYQKPGSPYSVPVGS